MLIIKVKTVLRSDKKLYEDAMQGDTLSVNVAYPGFPVGLCLRVRCAS